MSLTERQLSSRYGGLKSWAQTVDRTARTANGRAAAPGQLDYWIARLDDRFDDATDEQRRQAAEAARKAYFVDLARKSARSRARRTTPNV
jgi:hypothetical protein